MTVILNDAERFIARAVATFVTRPTFSECAHGVKVEYPPTCRACMQAEADYFKLGSGHKTLVVDLSK